MQYLLDTVTLIRHFTDEGKIGKEASLILSTIKGKENSFVISIISLMEIMYLAEKNRININLSETLNIIKSSYQYSIINLTPEILNVAQTLNFYELHDMKVL